MLFFIYIILYKLRTYYVYYIELQVEGFETLYLVKRTFVPVESVRAAGFVPMTQRPSSLKSALMGTLYPYRLQINTRLDWRFEFRLWQFRKYVNPLGGETGRCTQPFL